MRHKSDMLPESAAFAASCSAAGGVVLYGTVVVVVQLEITSHALAPTTSVAPQLHSMSVGYAPNSKPASLSISTSTHDFTKWPHFQFDTPVVQLHMPKSLLITSADRHLAVEGSLPRL